MSIINRDLVTIINFNNDNYDLIKNEIINSKQNVNAILIKNIAKNTPNWDNFMNHLNYQYHKESKKISANPHLEYFINGVLFKKRLYVLVDRPTIEFFPQLIELRDILNKIGNHTGDVVGAYLNFAKEVETLRHSDSKDHMYWQCINNTEWTFYRHDKMDTVVVEPGDLVFIPKTLDHEVFAPSSRAAIQLVFELTDKKEI